MSRPILLTNGIKDASDVDIVNLNASWTSKWYPLLRDHLGIHLGWDDVDVEGTLYIDYSVDTLRVDEAVELYDVFDTKVLDGTFSTFLFLDTFMPIHSYRLRFVHSSGTALLKSHTVQKGG